MHMQAPGWFCAPCHWGSVRLLHVLQHNGYSTIPLQPRTSAALALNCGFVRVSVKVCLPGACMVLCQHWQSTMQAVASNASMLSKHEQPQVVVLIVYFCLCSQAASSKLVWWRYCSCPSTGATTKQNLSEHASLWLSHLMLNILMLLGRPGRAPLRLFAPRSTNCKLRRLPMDTGMLPARRHTANPLRWRNQN